MAAPMGTFKRYQAHASQLRRNAPCVCARQQEETAEEKWDPGLGQPLLNAQNKDKDKGGGNEDGPGGAHTRASEVALVQVLDSLNHVRRPASTTLMITWRCLHVQPAALYARSGCAALCSTCWCSASPNLPCGVCLQHFQLLPCTGHLHVQQKLHQLP